MLAPMRENVRYPVGEAGRWVRHHESVPRMESGRDADLTPARPFAPDARGRSRAKRQPPRRSSEAIVPDERGSESIGGRRHAARNAALTCREFRSQTEL